MHLIIVAHFNMQQMLETEQYSINNNIVFIMARHWIVVIIIEWDKGKLYSEWIGDCTN